MNPITAFIYGATRSGKTHLALTMRKYGRVVVADYDGQVMAEAPDAYQVTLPPVLPADAPPEAEAERIAERDRILAVAAKAEVVVWPCYTMRDHHVLNAALQAGRLGLMTGGTYLTDSLTFMGDTLIADICGVTIVHSRKGQGDVEAADPVLQAMPDFTGQGMHRSMEQRDWMRYAQKHNEIVVGSGAICRRLGMSFIVTALEEKRELWTGEGQGRRLVGIQQGPMLRGRVSAADIPPKFMFYLRCASRLDQPVPEKPGVMKYAAFTVPMDGWPAGVRGAAAQLLPQVVPNPSMPAILEAAGLAEAA